jgi:hypothetical protein
MAELGRAQPLVSAVIGVLLTANMSFLYVDAVGTKARAARQHAHVIAAAKDKPHGFVIFGKTDSALGAPTTFAARADGSDLRPSSLPPRRVASAVSHDRSHYVVVARRDVWVISVEGGDPRKLTSNVTSAAPRDPVWSPDDKYVAFVWKGNIVVMSADGKKAGVAYRAPVDAAATEYISLFDWTDANMAG